MLGVQSGEEVGWKEKREPFVMDAFSFVSLLFVGFNFSNTVLALPVFRSPQGN